MKLKMKMKYYNNKKKNEIDINKLKINMIFYKFIIFELMNKKKWKL